MSLYACKKCRTKLFKFSDISEHSPGSGQESFSWTKREKGSRGKIPNCSSFFIHNAMEWMGDTSELEGKLDCPKCSGRIGSFTWHGAQCSCGYWATPALQVLKSRVDEIKPSSGNIIRKPIIRTIPDKLEETEVIVNEEELLDFL